MTSCEIQELNVISLCESVPSLAKERCPQLLHKAEFVCHTFKKAFNLFGNCHRLYDSGGKLTEEDITDLGK